MALIKCTECQKEISDKAKSCPHCGYPQEEINASITTLTSEKTIKNNPPLPMSSNSFENGNKLWIVFGAVAILLIVIVSAFNSGVIPSYKKYAGKYYSHMAGTGSYANYPATIIFEEDGTGRYALYGNWYSFNYKLHGTKVTMNAGLAFDYNGYFSESGSYYKVEDSSRSLIYGKRSD